MAISKSLFTLENVKRNSYELHIKFFDETEKMVSTKKFSLLNEKMIDDSKLKEGIAKFALGDELVDIYSENGVCSPDILKTLFSNRDEQGIKKACKMVTSLKFKGPTIFVLDLKDPVTGYKENLEQTIVKCENAVCDFFKSKIPNSKVSRHAKKIHSSSPDFVLCQGRLKMDLLKCGGFSASEIDYFHTPSGVKSFCQCTEFFMNAFKMGGIAQGENGVLLANKYIVPISDKFPLKAIAKSTVLYPLLYKDLYSIEGDFAKTLGKVYSISGKFDTVSNITMMSVIGK